MHNIITQANKKALLIIKLFFRQKQKKLSNRNEANKKFLLSKGEGC